MKPDTPYLEHNILLYIENLKAKVSGFLEYSLLDNPEVVKKIPINTFYLDIGREDQHIIKNHTFKDFWNSVAEVEEMLKNDSTISVQ